MEEPGAVRGGVWILLHRGETARKTGEKMKLKQQRHYHHQPLLLRLLVVPMSRMNMEKQGRQQKTHHHSLLMSSPLLLMSMNQLVIVPAHCELVVDWKLKAGAMARWYPATRCHGFYHRNLRGTRIPVKRREGRVYFGRAMDASRISP